jgi:hypothetical protein
VSWSPLQRRALEALGLTPVQRRGSASAMTTPSLASLTLPPKLRGGLERWVGALWNDWPAPEGRPEDAGFKRALWRRVRDWRRGG